MRLLFIGVLLVEFSFLSIYGISIVFDTTIPFPLIDAYQNIPIDKAIKDQKSAFTKYYDNDEKSDNKYHKAMGAWTPNNPIYKLENLKKSDQLPVINELLKQGFEEYYFTMTDYKNHKVAKRSDDLLDSADKTNLKIIIILLPPSEGGQKGNYDWHGWIKYFNSLKRKHPTSFQGFTIDDFNWISTRNDTKYRNNMDFMEHSGLLLCRITNLDVIK